MKDDLTIHYVQEMNIERSKVWHKDSEPWTAADWSNALAGEVGEICNKVKKLRRIQTKMAHLRNQSDKPEDIVATIGEEVAGAFLYLGLLCHHLGLDMAQCIVAEFNRVSVQQGFAQRLFIDSTQRPNEAREVGAESLGSVANP